MYIFQIYKFLGFFVVVFLFLKQTNFIMVMDENKTISFLFFVFLMESVKKEEDMIVAK